jgi:hypothetical protein
MMYDATRDITGGIRKECSDMVVHMQGWEAMMNGALAREAANWALDHRYDPDYMTSHFEGYRAIRDLYRLRYAELRVDRREMLEIPPGVGNCGYGGYK